MEPKRVLVNVVHQVWVDVVEPGRDNRRVVHLVEGEEVALTDAEAEAHVALALRAQDWGGYSMLGKALGGHNPWDAVSIEVDELQEVRPTQSDLLFSRGR